MKYFKFIAIIFLFGALVSSTFAGDKEDVEATLVKTIEAFNNQDYKTYFSAFADDNTAFTTVGSPLRFDAKAWKEFIEGTSQLQYVNYYQQDNVIRIYNGDTAVISGYYKFK
ncbi:MAG: nuclear transport factor 2 family protein, partial [Ignavibacteriaceae bacterium]